MPHTTVSTILPLENLGPFLSFNMTRMFISEHITANNTTPTLILIENIIITLNL